MTKVGIGLGLMAIAAGMIALWPDPEPTRSPYGAQDSSEIRGLTPQEIDDLRAGRGAGFARMAELNSYPGPRHVLDMADDLELDASQRLASRRIFEGMQQAAVRLGGEILSREQALSTAFAERRVRSDSLEAESAAIGALYGQLRAVHLRAHVELTALLRPEQIVRYDELRGYHAGSDHAH